MYEIERKYQIHINHLKPFIDRLTALHFELDKRGPIDQKTIYLTQTDPYIKLRISRSQAGQVKIKTEYELISRKTVPYKTWIKGKEAVRYLPFIETSEINKQVAKTVLSTSSSPVVITKLRRTFKLKPSLFPTGLSKDLTHMITVDFDEVQNIGRDNLFVEFKIMSENLEFRSEALKAIDELVTKLKPFVGEFPGDSYLKLYNDYSKSL